MAGHTAPSSNEKDLKRWKAALPVFKDEPMSSKSLCRFFKLAAKLATTCGLNTQQEVVQCLGDKDGKGLQRIAELIDQKYRLDAPALPAFDIFTGQLLPLLCVITHPDVASSEALLQPLDRILGAVYGSSGARVTTILQWSTEALGAFQASSDNDHAELDAALKALVVFVDQVAKSNSLSQINSTWQVSLKAISDIVVKQASRQPCSHDAHDALVTLSRLSTTFLLNLKLPIKAIAKKAKPPEAKATFEIKGDPPGGRHSNDSIDFTKISILPPPDEIACEKDEYLPMVDVHRNFHQGIDGLLDRSFRLLREDTIGQLRDAVREVVRNLRTSGEARRRGQRLSTHVYAYRGVAIQSLEYDEDMAMALTVSFNQPVEIINKRNREDYWIRQKRLDPEALICLIGADGNVMFATVHALSKPKGFHNNIPKKVAKMKQLTSALAGDVERGAVTIHPISSSDHALRPLVQWRRYPVDLVLVEFPGVVLPAFKPTLEALQSMQKQSDLAMIEAYLVPEPTEDDEEPVEIRPPLYTSRPGFEFNMECLTDDESPLIMVPGEPFDVDKIATRTSLDPTQSISLHHCLTNELAVIQGPPGTGKSYLGAALMRVLLANKLSEKNPAGADLGPIVVVTYTNHALDQTLEHLLVGGVNQIIRIGGRSKSDALRHCNLRNLSMAESKTKSEKAILHGIRQEKDVVKVDLTAALEKLRVANDVATFAAYLQEHYDDWYDAIFDDAAEEQDGWQKVQAEGKVDPVTRWVNGGSKVPPGAMHREIEDLIDEGFNEATTLVERGMIVHYLYLQFNDHLESMLVKEVREHEDVETKRKGIMDDKDLRILQAANIIGVTTSGLAKNLHLLRKLSSKVLVVEEAAEVLEAHLLTTFLPSIEHVILIGDHRQLKPTIANYDLSSESREGLKYSLDISLFERLIEPQPGFQRVPYCTLNTQRRMHPSISQLIRTTLYPDLVDAETVMRYPQVVGMRKRLFWLDHRNHEGMNDNLDVSTSKWNDYEVRMVTALVGHLIAQGTYEAEDIAVLTPYVSQLARLRSELGKTHAVVLGEKDVEELENLNSSDDGSEPSVVMEAQSTTLLKALRLATVDNFQGDEAKVIIVSLVRSNRENNCGFLRTTNRINVALSRAKHGMYIIGNSETASHGSDMWRDVVNMLRTDGNIGRSLQLQCPRHTKAVIEVSEPEDFEKHAPQGGCIKPCGKLLECGHACKAGCHSEVMHLAARCGGTCLKPLDECGHPCSGHCGDDCKKTKCSADVHFNPPKELPCGHTVDELPCSQAQMNVLDVPCPVIVEIARPCGHKVKASCDMIEDELDTPCMEPCDARLSCGHKCQRKCFMCKVPVEINGETQVNTHHAPCKTKCGKTHYDCGHPCNRDCHNGRECPPCLSMCGAGCNHTKICRLPCSEPCTFIPCSLRCHKSLQCGHQCPGICGETCPSSKFCHVCASGDIQNLLVDTITATRYRFINPDISPCIFPVCGHVLTAESLDLQVGLEKYYATDGYGRFTRVLKNASTDPDLNNLLKCAVCNAPLAGFSRYKLLRGLASQSPCSRETIEVSELDTLSAELESVEDTMRTLDANDHIKIYARMVQFGAANELQSETSRQAFSARYKDLHNLHDNIAKYLEKLEGRMQKAAGKNLVVIDEGPTANEKAHVRALAMLQHCKMLGVNDLMRLRHSHISKLPPIKTVIDASGSIITVTICPPLARVDFSEMRKSAKELIESATKMNDFSAKVLGSVSVAKLHAFQFQECRNKAKREVMKDLLQYEVDKLKTAIANHDGAPPPAAHELITIARMLQGPGPSEHVWTSEMVDNVALIGPKMRVIERVPPVGHASHPTKPNGHFAKLNGRPSKRG